MARKTSKPRRPYRTLAEATEAAQRYEQSSTVNMLALYDMALHRPVTVRSVKVEGGEDDGAEIEAWVYRPASACGGVAVLIYRPTLAQMAGHGARGDVAAVYADTWAREAYDRGVRDGSPVSMAWARLAEQVQVVVQKALDAERTGVTGG
jgi:hypothetical protein